jgi:hypothetical protein
VSEERLKVFISYRREESQVHALLLAEYLKSRAAADVFLDVESIPLGESFPSWIDREIATCDVALVLIGDDWLTIAGPDGRPRIEDPKDWVHVEIQTALERGVTIPILVEGATMPRTDQLPSPIAGLADRNAAVLRGDTWNADFEHLATELRRKAAAVEEPSPGTAPGTGWPARFSDGWFAANLPGMNSSQFDAMRAELHKRSWTDAEIARKVSKHLGADSTLMQHMWSEGTTVDRDGDAWPERFTDGWFATNVPAMSPEQAASLSLELRRRNWTEDEIQNRAFRHLGTEIRPPSIPVSRTPVMDEADPVARATLEAATDLEALDAAGRPVRERDLANALGRHLGGATVERRLRIPGWNPQPGNVDVFTTDWRGQPKLVIETKHKDGNDVFECLWDMAKVMSLATVRSVKGAYLVTGTTEANWARPVACAELFETGRHELVGAIRRYADWWERYILGDSTGRPLAVPAAMDVALVARVPLTLAGVAWELRAIRVSTPDTEWIHFTDGYPPAAGP